MADVKNILSAIVSTGSKIPDLSIKNAQLIFLKDTQQIALDYDNKRVFYNQIVTFKNEDERKQLLAPVNGLFYFVINTAILYTYQNKWIQITTPPENIVFTGAEYPEFGIENTVYINKNSHLISIWDEETDEYIIVADKTKSITEHELLDLFKK